MGYCVELYYGLMQKGCVYTWGRSNPGVWKLPLFFEYQIQLNINKQLTLQDKQKLIKMLKAHYQIKCESFINAIAEDETEKTDLTLKAFSMAMPKIEEIKNPLDNSESKSTDGDVTIKITHLGINKLCLVKAVKESIGLPLATAKARVDKIVGFAPNGEYSFTPVRIGDSGCIFTKEQWQTISDYVKSVYGNDSIKWYTL